MQGERRRDDSKQGQGKLPINSREALKEDTSLQKRSCHTHTGNCVTTASSCRLCSHVTLTLAAHAVSSKQKGGLATCPTCPSAQRLAEPEVPIPNWYNSFLFLRWTLVTSWTLVTKGGVSSILLCPVPLPLASPSPPHSPCPSCALSLLCPVPPATRPSYALSFS